MKHLFTPIYFTKEFSTEIQAILKNCTSLFKRPLFINTKPSDNLFSSENLCHILEFPVTLETNIPNIEFSSSKSKLYAKRKTEILPFIS